MTTLSIASRSTRSAYLVAALPLLLLCLASHEYGGGSLYVPLAIVCLAQVVYATRIGWGVVFAAYALGTGLFLWTLAQDVARVAQGQRTDIFVDLDDTAAFVVLGAALVALVVWLYRVRPRRATWSRAEWSR